MQYRSYLGFVTLIIGVISYGLYFRDIFRGRTKPHSVSWLVWGVLNATVFLAQRTNGAGAGSWITAFSAGVALIIFVISLKHGEKKITTLDWYCLFGACISLILWYKQQHSSAAVLLASTTFIFGFIPTYIKAYFKPKQETTATFALNGTKFLIGLLALNEMTFLTFLYPATVATLNFGFVFLLVVRTNQLAFKKRAKRR